MSTGEVQKQTVFVLDASEVVDTTTIVNENPHDKCGFCFPAFGDTSQTDDLLNDRHGFLFIFGALSTAQRIYLQKCDGSDSFADVIELTDNTYGTLYDTGFFTADNKKYKGYLLQWRTVLSTHGVGVYRLRGEGTSVLGTNNKYSFSFDLKNYSATEADQTVRLNFTMSNQVGDYLFPGSVKIFPDDWFSQIRLPKAYFGNESAEYETEEVRFADGVLQDVTNDQRPIFELVCWGGFPADVHRWIRSEVLQADEITVTDYNSANQSGEIRNLQIKHNGNYEPTYSGSSPLTPVTMTFTLGKNNLRKRLC